MAEVWKQNVQVQESVLKDRLNSIAQVLSDYIYDMEACIMPKDESQMMRVDRNDIWWNYDQIEGNVEDLEDILDDTASAKRRTMIERRHRKMRKPERVAAGSGTTISLQASAAP